MSSNTNHPPLGQLLNTFRLPDLTYRDPERIGWLPARLLPDGVRIPSDACVRLFVALGELQFKVNHLLLPSILAHLDALDQRRPISGFASYLGLHLHEDANHPLRWIAGQRALKSFLEKAFIMLEEICLGPNQRGNVLEGWNREFERGSRGTDFFYRIHDETRQLVLLKLPRALPSDLLITVPERLSDFTMAYTRPGWETTDIGHGVKADTFQAILVQALEQMLLYRCESLTISTYDCTWHLVLCEDGVHVADRVILRKPPDSLTDVKLYLALGLKAESEPANTAVDHLLSRIYHGFASNGNGNGNGSNNGNGHNGHGSSQSEHHDSETRTRRITMSLANPSRQAVGRFWLFAPSLRDSDIHGKIYTGEDHHLVLTERVAGGYTSDVYSTNAGTLVKLSIPFDLRRLPETETEPDEDEDDDYEDNYEDYEPDFEDWFTETDSRTRCIEVYREFKAEWEAYDALESLQGLVVPRRIATFDGHLNASWDRPARCRIFGIVLEPVGDIVCHPDNITSLPQAEKDAIVACFQQLHAVGVCHGDVATWHIRRFPGGGFRIVDFGQARCGASQEEMNKEMEEVQSLITSGQRYWE